jgi:hypothetical protein
MQDKSNVFLTGEQKELFEKFFEALTASEPNKDEDITIEFSGAGAEEVSEFTPTPREVLELARYWANLRVDYEYFSFLHACEGSDWTRERMLATHRLSRITDIIGDEQVRKIVAEVYEKFGKDEDPHDWNVFFYGTKEQREQVQDKVQRELKPVRT